MTLCPEHLSLNLTFVMSSKGVAHATSCLGGGGPTASTLEDSASFPTCTSFSVPRPIPSLWGEGRFGHFPTLHKCDSARGTLRDGIPAPVWDKALGKSHRCLSPTHFRTKGLPLLYHYLQDCWVRSSVKDL